MLYMGLTVKVRCYSVALRAVFIMLQCSIKDSTHNVKEMFLNRN